MADETALSPDDEDAAADETVHEEAVSEESLALLSTESQESSPQKGEETESAENEPPAQRRRETRDFEVTGDVTIDGKTFPLKDWSSSGFGIVSCDLEFEDHARVGIGFNVTHSAGALAFSCKAVIVRSDPVSCEVAGAFVEMSREDRVAVAAYFDALDEA